MKNLISNKYFRFFLPAALLVMLVYSEKAIDIIFGDGDGIITSGLFIKSRTFLKPLFIIWIIFNVFSILFRMGRKATLINFAVIAFILYGFNFYLKQQDPFLKGPFDSNYYYGNLTKYENFYVPPKNYRTLDIITWGHLTKRNRYGYRAKEITFKPKGVFRVMVLGDSFTWGAGLADNELYTSVLDSMLKKHFNTENIEVINCGIGAAPTITERDVLRKLKDTVQPDLIVVGFCLNDPQPLSQDYSKEKEKFNKEHDSLFRKIRILFSGWHLNYIGDLIPKSIINYNLKKGTFPEWQVALKQAYDTSSKEWKDFTKALRDIKNMSDSLGCPKPIMGVFNQASCINYHDQIGLEEQRDLTTQLNWLNQVYEASSKIGFKAINYYALVDKEVLNKKLTRANAVVNPMDGHPSPLLNRIFAKEIFKQAVPLIESKLNESHTKDNQK